MELSIPLSKKNEPLFRQVYSQVKPSQTRPNQPAPSAAEQSTSLIAWNSGRVKNIGCVGLKLFHKLSYSALYRKDFQKRLDAAIYPTRSSQASPAANHRFRTVLSRSDVNAKWALSKWRVHDHNDRLRNCRHIGVGRSDRRKPLPKSRDSFFRSLESRTIRS